MYSCRGSHQLYRVGQTAGHPLDRPRYHFETRQICLSPFDTLLSDRLLATPCVCVCACDERNARKIQAVTEKRGHNRHSTIGRVVVVVVRETHTFGISSFIFGLDEDNQ